MALITTSFPLPLPLPLPSLHHQFSSKSSTLFHPLTTISLSNKSTIVVTSQLTNLPIRKIPGDYGLPVIGPWRDRLDYFYNQGKDEFFKSTIQKYESTVFRTNMPPGPFISSNPNVIALLDGKSFPILFDVIKVNKKNVFTGTFMPSVELTGGYRVLSYLDPSEPHHEKLKKLISFLLSSRRDHVIPEFHETFKALFETLHNQLSEEGKADFNSANDKFSFDFLARALLGVDPAKTTNLGADTAPRLISKWVLFQLHPVLTLGLPKILDDLILHTFRLPPVLVKKDYERLYEFFFTNMGSQYIDQAKKLRISEEEACHNLLFATCFNSFGGMKIFIPTLIKWIAKGGVDLQTRLANEIRSEINSSVRDGDGKISIPAMEKMQLMKSVVYEALRINPPVASQYGRAKHDFMFESHEAVFEVKKGEMLYGYQPFATKDPQIFDRPEEFVADRFVGEENENLLKHVLWSNGPETENPTLENKQCVGKDFVVLVSRLFVTEFFLLYDTIDVEVGSSTLGTKITITSLKKA